MFINYRYFTIVIEDESENLIVAAGTILIERKFVHNNGLVRIYSMIDSY